MEEAVVPAWRKIPIALIDLSIVSPLFKRRFCLHAQSTFSVYLSQFAGVLELKNCSAGSRICVETIQFRKQLRGGSLTQIARVVQLLKKEHDRLTKEMRAIGAALSAFGAAYGKGTAPRGGISAAGRARIAAAQRARWVRVKAKGGKGKVVTMPKKRTMSASARRRIAAAQRARWAKVKAAKKSA
jgi:hypothetical protein